MVARENEKAYLEVTDSSSCQAQQLTLMTQNHLTESQDAMTQRIMSRESRPSCAQSFSGKLHPILQLQRMLGNRRVAQLVQAKQLFPEGKIIGLQPKLTVGAADDQYEQEANRVARQVMNTSDAAAARSMQHALPPEEGKDRRLQSKPLAASITPFVPRQQMVKEESQDKGKLQAKLWTETSEGPMQRQPEIEEEESEPIQAKSAGALTESFEAGADVETQVSQSKGRGNPLPDSVRNYMESRFGADFSGVRAHAGSGSTQLNRSLSAQAFTVGGDIYYGAGKSPTDLSLTAHELTHVVQQTGGGAARREKRPLNFLSTVNQSAAGGLALQRRVAPTEVRNVELRTPPKRPEMQPAVPRAVPASIRLAEEIDAANQLTDDELIGRRAQVAIEAAAAANDMDEAARKAELAARTGGPDAQAAATRRSSLQSAYEKLLRRLEAIEYVANWRRLPPLKSDRFRYQDTRRALATRRANFRLEVEERVRKTGSLEEALKGMSPDAEAAARLRRLGLKEEALKADAEEVQAIRKEAAEFRSAFKGEAWLNAERMLLKSQDVMFGVLESYGLPPGLGERAVRRMQDEKLSEEAAAQFVIDEVLKRSEEELDKTVNAAAPEKKRAQLVFAVRRLKEIQKRVAETKRVAEGGDVEWSARGPKTDARIKAKLELPTAQNELKAYWMEAEREHPILAAYRGRESELEKIDLGKLDVSAEQTNQQMKEVLVRVLPKLYDNGRALWLLKHNRLNPIAMPPVVALTSATMFVPEGSIRAGVVRDLLDEEKSSRESWLVAVATTALAIVTLLPTGGMSAVLIPAGIASAGFAAYSALKIYDKYEQQKLLVNTDLDLARALSNEEPSLRGFAWNLVAAGLEGFALFRLWRKAVELRKLAMERQTLSEAIDDFKVIMNEQKLQAQTDKFLNEVLKGTPAEEAAKAAGKPPTTEPSKSPAKPGRTPPATQPKSPPPGEKPPAGEKPSPTQGEKPSPTQAEKSPASKGKKGPTPKVSRAKPPPVRAIHVYRSREAVVEAVEKRLAAAGLQRPPGWERVLEALKANPGHYNNQILANIGTVMDALQNPKLYAEVLGDAWQMVKNLKAADINDALEKMVLASGVKVHRVRKVKLGGEFFKQHVSKNESWIDEALAAEDHGQMTHLLQDLVVDRVLGAGGSARFRSELLKNAEGTIKRYVQRRKGDTLTNSRFTQLPSGQPLPNEVFMDVYDKVTGKLIYTETEMKLGDYVWRFTYDLFYKGEEALKQYGRLPQPERLRPALNEIGIELK